MSTFTEQIVAGSDDGYWDAQGGSTFDNSSAFIEFAVLAGVTNDHGFFRFSGVTIPAGSQINSATLTLVTTAPAVPSGSLSLRGELSANPTAVSSAADGNGRSLTTNIVSPWTVTPWNAGLTIVSPDLSTIIQEIINQAGWASGNAIQLFVNQGSTNTSLRVVGDDGTHPANRATITITYTTSPAPAPAAPFWLFDD